jgi:hypothetical protein
MNINQVLKRQLIIDTGNENDVFVSMHTIKFENKNRIIQFNFSELVGLEDIDKDYKQDLLDNILQTIGGIKKGLVSYKNKDGLKIYVLDRPDLLCLLSVGEFQPGRYKIILEAAFDKVADYDDNY